MGEVVGYIRVSSADQNTGRQLEGVAADRTYTDKCSGGSTDRPQLQAMLSYVREGDTVIAHSIDRLARNTADLLQLVESLTKRGVSVRFHKENLTFSGDAHDPFGTLMMTMLAGFAQFERAIIRERQREGITKAKQRGVYQGRSKSIDRERVAAMLRDGVSPTQIASALGIGRASVYRLKEELGVGHEASA